MVTSLWAIASANTLQGLAGDDVITGYNGNDTLQVSDGN